MCSTFNSLVLIWLDAINKLKSNPDLNIRSCNLIALNCHNFFFKRRNFLINRTIRLNVPLCMGRGVCSKGILFCLLAEFGSLLFMLKVAAISTPTATPCGGKPEVTSLAELN